MSAKAKGRPSKSQSTSQRLIPNGGAFGKVPSKSDDPASPSKFGKVPSRNADGDETQTFGKVSSSREEETIVMCEFREAFGSLGGSGSTLAVRVRKHILSGSKSCPRYAVFPIFRTPPISSSPQGRFYSRGLPLRACQDVGLPPRPTTASGRRCGGEGAGSRSERRPIVSPRGGAEAICRPPLLSPPHLPRSPLPSGSEGRVCRVLYWR